MTGNFKLRADFIWHRSAIASKEPLRGVFIKTIKKQSRVLVYYLTYTKWKNIFLQSRGFPNKLMVFHMFWKLLGCWYYYFLLIPPAKYTLKLKVPCSLLFKLFTILLSYQVEVLQGVTMQRLLWRPVQGVLHPMLLTRVKAFFLLSSKLFCFSVKVISVSEEVISKFYSPETQQEIVHLRRALT